MNRANITPTPISKSITRQVCALAVKDMMSKDLKIINRANVTLHDSAWTAGVEYEYKDYKSNDKVEEFKEEN